MDIEYTGEEKRRQGKTLTDVAATFEHKLIEHETREKDYINQLISELVSGAFPDGILKHSEYHLAKITAAKEEAEYWKAAKLELTKGGVSAVLWVLKTVLILSGIGLMYKLGLGALVGTVVTK